MRITMPQALFGCANDYCADDRSYPASDDRSYPASALSLRGDGRWYCSEGGCATRWDVEHPDVEPPAMGWPVLDAYLIRSQHLLHRSLCGEFRISVDPESQPMELRWEQPAGGAIA